MISHSKLLTLLTRKTSVTLNISEQIVDEVITHQWKSAQDAVKRSNSIEISGLGKFVVRDKSVNSKYKTLLKNKEFLENKAEKLKSESNFKELEFIEKKIKDIIEDIEYLKQKIHE